MLDFSQMLRSGQRRLTPPLTVSLTVKYPGFFFDDFPNFCQKGKSQGVEELHPHPDLIHHHDHPHRAIM